MICDSDKLPSEYKPVDPAFNPLMRFMDLLKFEKVVRFYEADQALTPDDRKVISAEMNSILYKSFLVTSPAIAMGVYLPTLIARMRGKPVAYSGMLYRPFLSIVSGLVTAQITNKLAVRFMFKQKASTEDTPERKKVWSTMVSKPSPFFYFYFKKTASDPSYILPDPRTLTQEELHKAHCKKLCGNKLHVLSKCDAIRGESDSDNHNSEFSTLRSDAKCAWDRSKESRSRGNSGEKE